jgi:hypothetical protein
MDVRKLVTIQRRNKLNNVFAQGETGECGERSEYAVVRPTVADASVGDMIAIIQFQRGPRDLPGSLNGVLDVDLLEMVRDRMTAFQDSKLACPENMMALQHIEAALMYLNKRVEDRAERGSLGTMKI